MKLRVRKYKIFDLERHLKLLVMNGVYKNITQKSREKEKKWLEKAIRNYSKGNPEFYVLAITLNKKIIGNIVLERINYKTKTGHIGYWVGKSYQGKGYTTKAIDIFLKRIKRKFGIKKVIAETKVNNISSQRVLEKNNFRKDKNSGREIRMDKKLE